METENKINKILQEIKQDCDLDENILENYMLDSFDVIKLIVAIEKWYNIKIKDEDLDIKNFESKSAILKTIERNS